MPFKHRHHCEGISISRGGLCESYNTRIVVEKERENKKQKLLSHEMGNFFLKKKCLT